MVKGKGIKRKEAAFEILQAASSGFWKIFNQHC